MKVVLKTCSLVLILMSFSFALNEHIIMSYNLLNYPADTTARNPSFRTIIAAVVPDVLVVQEVTSQAGVNGFLSNVLNSASSGYAAGVFLDGPDTDNAVFYKSSLFQFISNTAIPTSLRDINEFKLVYIPTGDTLRIFSVHLKASNTTADINQRAAEAATLRAYTNNLPAGSNFIVTGDFNMYAATEPAYQNLISQTGTGYFIDPLTMPGAWNVSSYAPYHTQSPRVRAFGGGSTGGMDDRFDLILMSKAIDSSGGITYVEGSMTAYGNDGSHFNDSINKSPNTAVGQTIANALHAASDHIPVYARFNFTAPVAMQLNVKAYIEALYDGSSMISDSVSVEVRSAVSPYTLVEQKTITLSSAGDGSGSFGNAVNSLPYYIVVKHSSSIETWSSTAVSFSSGVLNYDFTTASSKAYGNNLVLRGGEWCIYSGDINQDGFINAADLNLVYNSNVGGLQGYSVTDVNKDLYTEIQDISFVFINNILGIQKRNP